MPAKFKESEGLYRNRKKVGMKHYYLHATPTTELVEAYERDSTKPKHKNKFKNELVKRGVLSY
jgi:hypothetical protein